MFGFNPLYTAVLGLMGGPSPALSLDFLNGELSSAVTFSRASNATMFDSAGRLVWAPANLLRSTQNITLSPWKALGTTPPIVTYGETAPDGTSTATFVDVSLAADCRLAQTTVSLASVPDNAPFTFSAWIKRAPGETSNFLTSAYRRKDGSVTSVSLPISDTWQRVSFTVPSALTGASSVLIWVSQRNGDTVTKYLVWNPMLTLGTDLLPFVPNTSATAEYFGPRLDYNPETLAQRGLLLEAQRTSSVRNNALVGGVAGTPGTAPTNWSISSIAGITITTAYGVEDGIPYIDVTYSGTNTSGSNAFPVINIEPPSGVAAAGQTWTHSCYVRKVAGADDASQFNVDLRGRDAAQALISGQQLSRSVVGGASLNVSRNSATLTLTSPAIAFVQPRITRSTLANGASMDITLRIGGSQLEQGNFATSLIPTYGVAATRAGDVADLVSDAPWNPAGMTYCAQFERQGNPVNSAGEATSALFYFGDASTYVNGVFGFGSSNQVRCDMANGGVLQSQVSVTPQPCVPLQVYKWATRIAPNDAKMYANGVAGTPDVTVTMPATIPGTRKAIGRSNAESVQQMHGWLRGLQVYTQALDDTTLQALSS